MTHTICLLHSSAFHCIGARTTNDDWKLVICMIQCASITLCLWWPLSETTVEPYHNESLYLSFIHFTLTTLAVRADDCHRTIVTLSLAIVSALQANRLNYSRCPLKHQARDPHLPNKKHCALFPCALLPWQPHNEINCSLCSNDPAAATTHDNPHRQRATTHTVHVHTVIQSFGRSVFGV